MDHRQPGLHARFPRWLIAPGGSQRLADQLIGFVQQPREAGLVVIAVIDAGNGEPLVHDPGHQHDGRPDDPRQIRGHPVHADRHHLLDKILERLESAADAQLLLQAAHQWAAVQHEGYGAQRDEVEEPQLGHDPGDREEKRLQRAVQRGHEEHEHAP